MHYNNIFRFTHLFAKISFCNFWPILNYREPISNALARTYIAVYQELESANNISETYIITHNSFFNQICTNECFTIGNAKAFT